MIEATAAGALQGYRILDVAGTFSLYCTKLLADLGADVIRIEPPEGDSVRKAEPFAGDEPGLERSLQHFYFNTNKRGVTLDLETAAGRDLFRRLAASADVIVEAFEPGYMASLGLGYDDLSRANPGLVMTSITGFGQTGPHAHWQSNDLVALATSGVLTLSGFIDRPPYRPYPAQAVYCAGIEGANATLLALFERESSGRGQWIDVSAQESLSMAQETAMQLWDFQRRSRPRIGRVQETGLGSINECADGYIYGMFGLLGRNASMADLVRWMDEEGLAEDLVTGGALDELDAAVEAARGGGGAGGGRTAVTVSPELMARIVPAIRRFLKARTKDYLYSEGQRRGFFVAAVNDTRDLVESEQLRHQRWFQDVSHPELGRTIEYPGVPYAHAASPARLSRRAPLLGEHNEEVFGEREHRPAQGMREGGRPMRDSQRLPLEGIRVADFSWYGAGPIGAQKLAWYGAEVIRIESETRPDGLRNPGVARPGATGLNASGYYNNFNSNKLCLTLNMGRPEARDLALRLIAECDVVLENYQPSVFDKWDLTYETMKAVREDIIFVRMPMEGVSGPHRTFQGFGAAVTNLTGISHLSGFPDRPPIGVGSNYPDYVVNCGHGSIAVLAALLHRRRGGRGQFVEVAQVASTAAVVGPAILEYTVNGRVAMRNGNRQHNAAPHGAFPCLSRPRTPPVEGVGPNLQMPADLMTPDEERWCVITVFSDAQWTALKQVMGNPAWAEQDCFADLPGRKAGEELLEALVSDWTRGQDADDLAARLQTAGVPAGVVQTAEDVLDHDEHLRERGYYVYLDHPETGRSAYDGSPFKMSRTPGGPVRPAPLLGEHTYHIAREIIGLSEEEIAELTASQVLH